MNPMARREAPLVHQAVGLRHGVVPSVDLIATTLSDLPGVWHASVPDDRRHPAATPAGGVGWSAEDAKQAAVGEAVERYAAGANPVEGVDASRVPKPRSLQLDGFSLFDSDQRRKHRFPHRELFDRYGAGGGCFAEVHAMVDNSTWWAPRFLVALSGPDGHGLASSSGLAAGSQAGMALLRAIQELVERDALMTVWTHSLPGVPVPLGAGYSGPVAERAGEVLAFDATPDYSPHPVALVCGWLPRRGRRRVAMGAACRATWGEAVDKAFLEWAQGLVFASSVLDVAAPAPLRRPKAVRTFAHHAAYYTMYPKHWDEVPLLRGVKSALAQTDLHRESGHPEGPAPGTAEQLADLVFGLAGHGVRLFYRDLTTCDAAQMGVTVVRVISPDLTPIHAEHAWPFLGGRARHVSWRYPWAPPSCRRVPNRYPHPLG